MMMKWKEKIAVYLRTALHKRCRAVVGIMVCLGLMLVTLLCYETTVSSKQLLLSLFLCVSSGVLIVFPMPDHRYISIPMVLLYLLLIPSKLFVRIEYPVHDMSRILPGAKLVNVLIMLLIYACCLLIFQRVHRALGFGTIFIMIVSLVNFYLNAFRGSSLTFNDLLATKTAMTVMDNYQLFMTWELWYSILYFVVFSCLGFWCKIPARGGRTTRYGVLARNAVAVAFILFFYIFFTKTDYLREHELQGHYWNTSENERLNGFLLSFLLSVEEKSMEKPSGYSDTALDEIAKEYSDYEKNVAAEKPNIIFIMNEAWSDLRVITDIDTSQDVMPFTDSLVQNTVKGNLHVGILGGLTANSEFEALTGDSLAFLDAAAIPYQLQIDHPIASMASVLKQQGYQTIAMHPSGAAAWNREKVYEYMGFDDFISVDEFEAEYEYVRTFISDACNFEEIIYRYENRDKDKPFFLFDVTIQNHGSYYGGIDMPISVLRVGDRKASDVGYLKDLETYLNLMKLTDEAFEQLITYFNTVEEPTIICMFGDHQPVLTNDFYIAAYGKEDLTEEEMMQKYITPYVIWANYDAEFAEYGDMSANYLGAVLLDCAQVESPAYYRFLLELQKEYPVLSHIGCLDSSGARYRVDDIKKSEKISDYRKLQYNHLMEKNWKKLLFEVVHQ